MSDTPLKQGSSVDLTQPSSVLLAPEPGEAGNADAIKKNVLETYVRLPVLFIHNQGQVDSSVSYYAETSGQTIFLTTKGLVFDLVRYQSAETDKLAPRTAERLSFSLDLLNASNNPLIEGLSQEQLNVNYFIGNDPRKWHTDVPTYSEVVYRDVYPGIDLRLYGKDGRLEYEFIVNPGSSVDYIALCYSGIEGLAIEDGELVASTAFGPVIQSCPYIYQPIGDRVCTIDGGFRLNGSHTYGFYVASYDPDYPLVIDPGLLYSTYLGGSFGGDFGYGIAVDSSGYAYVTGTTVSGNFPTKNGYQTTPQGGQSAFVTKLDTTTSGAACLLYSSYLGGSDNITYGEGIAVDSSGCAYVTGNTESTNFPTLNGYQTTNQGDYDAFVTKIDTTKSGADSLLYSSYLGGNDSDGGRRTAVDSSGCAYVTGYTKSTNFPTRNGYQTTYRGGDLDAFVTKLDTTESGNDSLLYSSYLGGSDEERAFGIAVDSSECAYIAGETKSTNFPTRNGYQTTYQGNRDAFVTKLSTVPRNIPDIVGDYSIKCSIKFYDWKCNKWIVVKSGTLHITEQDEENPHKIKGYFEPGISIEGWPESIPVKGYVGPFERDAKLKIKNTPRLSLLAELGEYCEYPEPTYVTYILNAKIKMDKKTEFVKSIKGTINGWGEFGPEFTDVGGPSQGQFEGKFTATPLP